MDHEKIIHILREGDVAIHGQFVRGSNYTFLTRVRLGEEEVEAVYKPARGEQPLWDFPERSLGKREAAAYEVSQFLGWDLIPPTVYRMSKSPLGPGSLQFFFRHDPEAHYFSLRDTHIDKMLAICTFDCLVNNADRKGGHVLMSEDSHIWCIDQGLCFHVEDKLRTVIWDFAGQRIPNALLDDIHRLSNDLHSKDGLKSRLHPLLEPEEIGALLNRCNHSISHPFLPEYDPFRRMVPYPPL